MRLRGVVPNAHCPILGARGNQLLSDTDVEAGDLAPVKRSKDIFKLGVIIALVIDTVAKDAGRDKLTVRGDGIELVLILVDGDTADGALSVALRVVLAVAHGDWDAGTIEVKQRPLVAIFRLVDSEHVFDTNDESILEGKYGINAFTNRGICDVGLVLAIVSAQEHLAIVSADEDHASHLRPAVAREVSGDVATLLNAVDLRVIMRKEYVVFLLPLLHVDIGVVWASD